MNERSPRDCEWRKGSTLQAHIVVLWILFCPMVNFGSIANPATGGFHRKNWSEFPPKSDTFPAKQYWSEIGCRRNRFLETLGACNKELHQLSDFGE